MTKRRNDYEYIERLLIKGNLLACCPINITEVYAGMRPGEEEATQRLLQSFQLYSVTFEELRLYSLQA